MVEGLHQIRRQSPGNGQHRRRHPRHHAGIHPADGKLGAPLSGQAGIGAQQVAVGRGLRAIDVVRAGRHAVGVGGSDEVVEDVGDRDRVDRVRRPRRKRNEQEPVADVTQHLERRRPGADDHRRTQPHHVGTAVEAQRMGDLGTAGQVFGQVVLVGDEPAEIHDPPNAGFLCRGRHIGGGTIVGVTKVRLADAVHQVIRPHRWDRPRRRRSSPTRSSCASNATPVTSSCQPKSTSRSGVRVAATTSWPASSRAVTSREPT